MSIMKGTPRSMARLKGSRALWRSSLRPRTRSSGSSRRPSPGGPLRLFLFDRVDEDVFERGDDPLDRDGRVAFRLQGLDDPAPAFVRVLDDHVEAVAEERGFEHPGLFFEALLGVQEAGRH